MSEKDFKQRTLQSQLAFLKKTTKELKEKCNRYEEEGTFSILDWMREKDSFDISQIIEKVFKIQQI